MSLLCFAVPYSKDVGGIPRDIRDWIVTVSIIPQVLARFVYFWKHGILISQPFGGLEMFLKFSFAPTA